MNRPLCIYHGNCADGFGAAWVVRKFFNGDVDFHPGVYQKDPPDVYERHVIMVDFSYKRPVINAMLKTAYSITILDHHKTAQEDLSGLPQPELPMFGDDIHKSLLAGGDVHPNLYALFDMERSGAGLTWDFFNPGEKRPTLIDHIEDRDLWRFKLPHTREIQSTVFSYPYDFEMWDEMIEAHENNPYDLWTQGIALERKHHKDVAELVETVTRPMRFKTPTEGHLFTPLDTVVVPVANLPYTLASDAGDLLCGRDYFGRDPGGPHPFAGCYWDKPSGRQFSLRSRDDGADVGAIAKIYGGGGHKHASGFEVPYSRLPEFEP